MTKQLRLAVGVLTDVGRRRERNQDNVIQYVPDDPDLLARRGALFVVCDGMGGHAAGEIASDIGVRTIRDAYYQDPDEDVVGALSRSVRIANAAIFEHAREHLAHTGMGTTCVAVALVGGRGYFVNIGDSRGYLLRNGTLRQITRDHSWVAEQVRAGVLTEDQARTHTHRNVITRSLGTQPEVMPDLFVESVRAGDRVLLCSDGLHGYVGEDEIQRTIVAHDPEPGVRSLIDLANTNGGPDNITAVVVQVLEVPVVAETVPLSMLGAVRSTSDIADVATIPITPHPVERATITAVLANEHTDEPAAISPASRSPKRTVWPRVGLRVVAVAALCLLALGTWEVLAGPYAQSQAANGKAQRDIARAQSVAASAASQDPTDALARLAAQQQQLQHDLTTLSLDAGGRAQVRHALDGPVASAVQAALVSYNTQHQITALPASAITSSAVSCGGSSLAALAATGGTPPAGSEAPPSTLYALSASGAVYAVNYAAGSAACGAAPLVPSGVRAVAADASQLYALADQGAGWVVLQVDASASATVKVTLPADTPGAPTLLAVQGGDFYVVYQQTTSAGSTLLHFNGDLKKPTQILTSVKPIVALTLSAGVPVALMQDGTLGSWDANGVASAVPVSLAPPVVTSDPSAYRAATPVPIVPPTPTPAPVSGSIVPAPTAVPTAPPASTAAAGTPPAETPTATTAGTPTPTAAATATPQPSAPAGAVTLFPGASSLGADRTSEGGLFIGDGTTPRVVRFTIHGTTLTLARQYVYASPRDPLRQVTSSPDGKHLFALSGDQLVEVTLPA